MTESADERWMREAVREAQKALGHTSPNPAVGCVLVANGELIARGFHRRAGSPHAEVECLNAVNGQVPAGATLYVTLEPCSTHGRTGPCTEAILKAGARSVVVGAIDPNPLHAGQGVEILRAAGVEVRTGTLAEECTALNEVFNKWIQTRMPFVIAKCGMSLDGRLTRPPGESQWLTNAAARRHAQKLRATVDAILIGAETLRRDNPHLTVRGIAGAKQPWRVVLTRSGKLPRSAHLFTDAHANRTLVFPNKPLAAVLAEFGAKEITSVLIEGGGTVLSTALDEGLIDRVQIYLAPLLSGGPVLAFGGAGAGATVDSLRLTGVSYEQLGDDLVVNGYAQRKNVV